MPLSDIANIEINEILLKSSTEEAVNLITVVGPCITTAFHSYSSREQPFYRNPNTLDKR